MLRNSITTRGCCQSWRCWTSHPSHVERLQGLLHLLSALIKLPDKKKKTKKNGRDGICGADIDDWAGENKVEVMEEEEERIPHCVFTVYSYSQSCREI